MRIGNLRHRIQIYSPTETRDANGGVIVAWTSLDNVWGSVEPLSGKEIQQGKQTTGIATNKITIRYRAGLHQTFRLIESDRIFGILSINVNADKSIMEIQVAQLIDHAPQTAIYNDDGAVVYVTALEPN